MLGKLYEDQADEARQTREALEQLKGAFAVVWFDVLVKRFKDASEDELKKLIKKAFET